MVGFAFDLVGTGAGAVVAWTGAGDRGAGWGTAWAGAVPPADCDPESGDVPADAAGSAAPDGRCRGRPCRGDTVGGPRPESGLTVPLGEGPPGDSVSELPGPDNSAFQPTATAAATAIPPPAQASAARLRRLGRSRTSGISGSVGNSGPPG